MSEENNGFAGKPASTTTNFTEIMEDLNAGIFAEQVGRAISDVSLGTVSYGDKGKIGEVNIKLKFKRIGESSQLAVSHSLSYVKPTSKGKATEESTSETPMHVGRGGRLTLMPESQGRLEFGNRD